VRREGGAGACVAGGGALEFGRGAIGGHGLDSEFIIGFQEWLW